MADEEISYDELTRTWMSCGLLTPKKLKELEALLTDEDPDVVSTTIFELAVRKCKDTRVTPLIQQYQDDKRMCFIGFPLCAFSVAYLEVVLNCEIDTPQRAAVKFLEDKIRLEHLKASMI